MQFHAVSLRKMCLQKREINHCSKFCFMHWGFASVQVQNHHRNHASLGASVHSHLPHPWSYEENELHNCWAKSIFWRTSQMNYSQLISPVICFEVFLVLLKLMASLLLMLVMQWKPQALYMSHVIWKAGNLRSDREQRRKEIFWVQNLMSLSLSIN